jgi:membrane fusion protein (multidrug efflux system)
MNDATVRAPLVAAPGVAAAPVVKSRLPFSRNTVLSVGAAIVLAVGGAIYIAAPKGSQTTEADASVQSAAAALIALNAEEKLAAANVRATQTTIRSADAQSERTDADRKRYENLVASGAVARREADSFKAATITAHLTPNTAARNWMSRNQATVVGAKRATLQAALSQSQAFVVRAGGADPG